MDHEFFTHQLDTTRAVGTGSACSSTTTPSSCSIAPPQGRQCRPFSSGTYIDAIGKTTYLSKTDFTSSQEETYTSPTTHGTYPIAWRIAVPSLGAGSSS